MKLKNKLSIAAIASIILSSTFSLFPVQAQTGEEQIDQTQVAAIAVPGGRFYNLVVMEQIPGKQQCWQESGSQPTVIDPLWTTFDFTGSCRRGTDSNAYSVRLDGQDTSQDYSLEVVEEGNELQLVAVSRTDRSRTIVGKTFGKGDGQYLKIYLNPGWKFSKKTFEGKALGHFFFSGDTQAIAAAGDNPPAPPEVVTSSFTDTATDTYQKEIEEAVALGFIAGFEDKTFKPEEPLTREQLVSMVIGALGTVSDLQVQAPDAATNQPYPDVTTARWSAAKIQWAKENEIVKGYPDGSFQPEKPVTRAELIAVLESAAKFANTKRGQAVELTQSQAPKAFTDISGHWGEPLIQQMSGYCGVASAYNETGDSFFPNNPSGRNYAAAATLRMHNCIAQPNP
jgi:N-acetylmuramoyl-L-alanine amidase